MAHDPLTHYKENPAPPIMVMILMKDGELVWEEANNRREMEILVSELIADKEVAIWKVYEEIKSSYPVQPASGGQQ